jgi:hypothetical protein
MERNRVNAIAALAAILALAACSERMPVAPTAGSVDTRVATQGAATGSYVLSFLKETSTGLVAAADTEPVGTYLVLKSEVKDAFGNVAQSGSVTYEYCWSHGNYAPTAVCNSGAGSWRRHMTMAIDPVGQLSGFGSCSTPRSIGFRFTFAGRSSGIASGVSEARDFTWVAPG